MLQRPTLPALALVFLLGLVLSATSFIYSTSSAGVGQRSGNGRAVLYLSYPPTSGTRCTAKLRIGYEAKQECCPKGFTVVGVRTGSGEAEAVCLEN